jgi:hypothetical protein
VQGTFAGVVELAFELPPEIPDFVREPVRKPGADRTDRAATDLFARTVLARTRGTSETASAAVGTVGT